MSLDRFFHEVARKKFVELCNSYNKFHDHHTWLIKNEMCCWGAYMAGIKRLKIVLNMTFHQMELFNSRNLEIKFDLELAKNIIEDIESFGITGHLAVIENVHKFWSARSFRQAEKKRVEREYNLIRAAFYGLLIDANTLVTESRKLILKSKKALSHVSEKLTKICEKNSFFIDVEEKIEKPAAFDENKYKAVHKTWNELDASYEKTVLYYHNTFGTVIDSSKIDKQLKKYMRKYAAEYGKIHYELFLVYKTIARDQKLTNDVDEASSKEDSEGTSAQMQDFFEELHNPDIEEQDQVKILKNAVQCSAGDSNTTGLDISK